MFSEVLLFIRKTSEQLFDLLNAKRDARDNQFDIGSRLLTSHTRENSSTLELKGEVEITQLC